MWPVVFPALTDVRLNTPRYALELDDHSFVAPRKRSVSPLDLKQWLCFKTQQAAYLDSILDNNSVPQVLMMPKNAKRHAEGAQKCCLGRKLT